MANAIFRFYVGKPYYGYHKLKREMRLIVKKVALEYAMENGKDISEALSAETVNAVIELAMKDQEDK